MDNRQLIKYFAQLELPFPSTLPVCCGILLLICHHPRLPARLHLGRVHNKHRLQLPLRRSRLALRCFPPAAATRRLPTRTGPLPRAGSKEDEDDEPEGACPRPRWRPSPPSLELRTAAPPQPGLRCAFGIALAFP